MFGTLLDDFAYNVEHEFLTKSREKDDETYISSLKKRYALDGERI